MEIDDKRLKKLLEGQDKVTGMLTKGGLSELSSEQQDMFTRK
jgi:hypothetical protein